MNKMRSARYRAREASGEFSKAKIEFKELRKTRQHEPPLQLPNGRQVAACFDSHASVD